MRIAGFLARVGQFVVDIAQERLTRACSWRAGAARGAAPAQRSDVALWSEGLCGRDYDRPQLMRGTLGRISQTAQPSGAWRCHTWAPTQEAR
jgi:hypothetical protein